MSDPVSQRLVNARYDVDAERYAELFLHDLDDDEQSRRALASFAALATERDGPVVDLGCGPGGVVAHLTALGLSVRGIDLSPGQIAQARKAFPDLDFAIGDLTDLDVADASLDAPVFLSFFGSRSADAHGTPFDHRVVTAHELFPGTVERLLRSAGFDDVTVEATPMPADTRPFDHVTILARAAGTG